MAKILSVELLSVPEYIDVSDGDTDITVVTKILFHDLDIQSNMEYYLHLFVYDVHGNIDKPLIIPNWDESNVVSITSERKDDFMGKKAILIKPTKKEITIETPMALKIGKLGRSTYHTRKLEVFATAAPAIGRVSKWSEGYETEIRR